MKIKFEGKTTKLLTVSIVLTGLILLSIFFTQVVFKNPMDVKITRKNYDSLVEKIRKNSSKEDFEKAQAIISLSQFAALGGKDPMDIIEGKSFNQIASDMKENAKKAEEEELQRAAIENEKINVRKSVLNSIKWEKENRSHYYSNYVLIGITLKNNKDKDIDAFQAEVEVYDKLNNKLATLYMKSTDKFPKNSTQTLSAEYSTIDFINKMQEIYDTRSEDLFFKFKPLKILFTDGTEI